MPDLPKLLYIRHGETEWSQSGRHTSRTDLPLLEKGAAEARELRPWLARMAPTHVICSPRLRALQTCELSGCGPTPQVAADVAEWDYGAFEGLRTAEIQASHPGWDLFRDGCPEGESPETMTKRVDRVIARLRELDGTIALFSHGHFGAALAARWLDLSMAHARAFSILPASLSILWHAHQRPKAPAIHLWNATPRDLMAIQ